MSVRKETCGRCRSVFTYDEGFFWATPKVGGFFEGYICPDCARNDLAEERHREHLRAEDDREQRRREDALRSERDAERRHNEVMSRDSASTNWYANASNDGAEKDDSLKRWEANQLVTASIKVRDSMPAKADQLLAQAEQIRISMIGRGAPSTLFQYFKDAMAISRLRGSNYDYAPLITMHIWPIFLRDRDPDRCEEAREFLKEFGFNDNELDQQARLAEERRAQARAASAAARQDDSLPSTGKTLVLTIGGLVFVIALAMYFK